MPGMLVRKAVLSDVEAIHALLEHYADEGVVLRRDRQDITERLGNFYVAEADGRFLGCGAARHFGGGLYEVRSLAVDPAAQGGGVGRALVEKMIQTLRQSPEPWRLFTLTTTPAFFEKLGFRTVAIDCFPEKIWSDCRLCPKRDRCDEIPLIYEEARDV